jgi:hypothetical protein
MATVGYLDHRVRTLPANRRTALPSGASGNVCPLMISATFLYRVHAPVTGAAIARTGRREQRPCRSSRSPFSERLLRQIGSLVLSAWPALAHRHPAP